MGGEANQEIKTEIAEEKAKVRTCDHMTWIESNQTTGREALSRAKAQRALRNSKPACASSGEWRFMRAWPPSSSTVAPPSSSCKIKYKRLSHRHDLISPRKGTSFHFTVTALVAAAIYHITEYLPWHILLQRSLSGSPSSSFRQEFIFARSSVMTMSASKPC